MIVQTRPPTVLTRAALNRALLARQMLLAREAVPVRGMVEHLLGLQAQAPTPPYYGLWSRIAGFDPHELGRMLTERELLRMTLMRGTIHLVTVDDALRLRPLVQDVFDRRTRGLRQRIESSGGRSIDEEIRAALAEEALTARELARRLVELGFGDDATALGYVVAALVPLVQIPPRGVWGEGGQARYATFEAWVRLPMREDAPKEELVLRYLGAFGPASVMDMQSWAGVTRLKPVFERLRSRLLVFRDEDGRELFDLPDAPRPDPEVPAPVRLLGEYDNVLLGHRDRRRIIPDHFPWDAMLAHGRYVNNLLVDGMLRATWWIEREGRRSATLWIRPHGKLSPADHDAAHDEAALMLAFAAADAAQHEVRFTDPVPEGAGSS